MNLYYINIVKQIGANPPPPSQKKEKEKKDVNKKIQKS